MNEAENNENKTEMGDDDEFATPAEKQAVGTQISALDGFNALKDTDAGDVVKAIQNQKVLDLAQNSEEVKEEMSENAKTIIKYHTDKLKTEAEIQNQDVRFAKNKADYELYGVEQSCSSWKMKMMNIGASIWFIIYWVIAFFTVVPLNTFVSMLSNILKKKWKVLMLAILFYIIIMVLVIGTPIIINLVSSATNTTA